MSRVGEAAGKIVIRDRVRDFAASGPRSLCRMNTIGAFIRNNKKLRSRVW
jgi:hypothetical protein